MNQGILENKGAQAQMGTAGGRFWSPDVAQTLAVKDGAQTVISGPWRHGAPRTGLFLVLGQSILKAPFPGSAPAEILRGPGQADRVAERRPLQVLPRGCAAVGDASECAVRAGAGTGEEHGAEPGEAQPGKPGAPQPGEPPVETRNGPHCPSQASELSQHSDAKKEKTSTTNKNELKLGPRLKCKP